LLVSPGPVIRSSVVDQTTFFLALADELPSTIKALNDGWLATYQISTVVVRALFHVASIKKTASPTPYSNPTIHNAISLGRQRSS